MRRVVARGVRGQRVGVPFEIYFEIQKPQGMAGSARLDYTPMLWFLNTRYAVFAGSLDF